MGYFNNKNNTNIDDEFREKKSFNFNKKKLMIMMVSLVLIVVLVIVIIAFRNKGSYSIVLDGEQNIKIYINSEYIEPGYHGYDKKGNDVTNQVVVNGDVNTKEIGEYTVTYTLKDQVIYRYISVVDKGIGTTYMYLNGDKTIYLKPGESYVEPGYVVIDTIDTDLKDKVVIDGNVDTSKPGSYRLVYSVVNSTGVTTSVSRTVIVLGGKISLSLSTKSSTTGPIYINVSVKDDHFDYMVLPNGTKVKNSEYSYKVSKNGTYKFTVYDTYGTKSEESIKVSNIRVVNNSSSTSSSSSTKTQTTKIAMPKVYTSDNITSGNKHSVGFLMKLTSSDGNIYYCLDSNNSCNPNTKYINQLRFAQSQQKYLRYKVCNSKNECSSVGSYMVNLDIQLINPKESTSTATKYGIVNPYQVAYYYQADSRWSSYDIYDNDSMAASGCGYASLAMLLTGITHDYSITPVTIIEKLSKYRTKYGIEFQTKSQNGALYDNTIHTHKYLKSDYNYDSSKLWRNDDGNIYSTAKKEKIVESLKMGHMIFANVPGHYVAFVGIDENDKIYVFDPAKGTSLQDVDTLYDDTYYNYRDKCTTIGRCGIRVAYEIYPTGGVSLEDWNKIK